MAGSSWTDIDLEKLFEIYVKASAVVKLRP